LDTGESILKDRGTLFQMALLERTLLKGNQVNIPESECGL